MKFRAPLSLTILFVLFNCCIVLGQSQSKHWEFAGWYGGGCYPNIEFDKNIKGRVYLVSDVAGIWRSDDLGEHWNYIKNGLDVQSVALIAVSPLDPNRLYAGTINGLFYSQNAGQSWQLTDLLNGEMSFSRPENYKSIALSRISTTSLCVGTKAGAVFCSKDAGKSWHVLGNKKDPFGQTSPITALMYSFDEKYLYASSAGGLMRYSFEGGQWSVLKDAPQAITDFSFSSHDPGTIYVAGQDVLWISKDEGITWEQSSPVPKGIITRVSVSNSTENPYLAVVWSKNWNGGILLSDDDGKTWIKEGQYFPDQQLDPTRKWVEGKGSNVASLKIDPFDEDVLYRTDWWGVWRSDDRGRTWHEKINGAPDTYGSGLYINSKDEIFVATMDDGLTKSSNEGRSYEILFPNQSYDRELNGHVWRVLSFGEGDNTVIATSSPWDRDINQIILSSDGGEDFQVIREGLPGKRPRVNTIWGQGYAKALAVDPTNSKNIYLGIDGDDGGGLYISKDGGKSWKYSSGQPASKRIYNALAVDPTDPDRIFWGTCDKDGGVFLSEDQGLTWKHVFKEMGDVFDLAIAPNGTIYVAGDHDGACLYVSHDSGKSWKLLKRFSQKGSMEGLVIDKTYPQRIAVSLVNWDGSPGKIYLSQDTGKDWQDITGDLPNGTGAAAMSFDHEGTYLYMLRYAGSVYKIKL